MTPVDYSLHLRVVKDVEMHKYSILLIILKHIDNLFVVTREPGGVPAAELIRKILQMVMLKWAPSHRRVADVRSPLRTCRANYSACSVCWLFPLFFDSTIVYQGIVGGVSHDIAAMNKILW